MKSHTLFRTVTVRPGIPLVVDVTANNFYLESSTDKVGVAFNEQGSFQMDSGKTVELPDGDSFQKITFTNPTTTDIVLTFYAGSLRVGTRTPYVYVRPSPTYIVASRPNVGLGNYTIQSTNLRSGQVSADRICRVIVQHVTSNGYVLVLLNAVQCAVISPLTAWQIETSQPIVLSVTGGANEVGIMAFYEMPA